MNEDTTPSTPSPLPDIGLAERGMLVCGLAEILRAPQSQARDLALCSVLEHLRHYSARSVSYVQIYLTAKALADEPGLDVDLAELGIRSANVLAECESLLTDYYPQFRARPEVQQMIDMTLLMGVTGKPSPARQISAQDVFGITTGTAPTQEPS